MTKHHVVRRSDADREPRFDTSEISRLQPKPPQPLPGVATVKHQVAGEHIGSGDYAPRTTRRRP